MMYGATIMRGPLPVSTKLWVGDVHWVVRVAVGVVRDEAYWCFIREDGDVVVGDIVVYCFVVDLFVVARSFVGW